MPERSAARNSTLAGLVATSSATSTPATASSTPPLAPSPIFRWLLLDVVDSSRPFLQALAAETHAEAGKDGSQPSSSTDRQSATASEAGADASRQRHVHPPVSTLPATVNQVDKRLSLPLGGSVASNTSTGSSGPSKKPSFIARLRSGSASISGTTSLEKENRAIDATAAGRLSRDSAVSPTLSAPIGTTSATTARQTVAAVALTSPHGADPTLAEAQAKALLTACGIVAPQRISAGSDGMRLETPALIRLAQEESIDAVYLGGGLQTERSAAKDLLEALLSSSESAQVKAIAVDPLITRSLTTDDAGLLISLAAGKSIWLALPTTWGKASQTSARALVRDCPSDVMVEKSLFSKSFTWDDTLTVLETLDELREPAVASSAGATNASEKAAQVEDLANVSMESAGGSLSASSGLPTAAADDAANTSSATLRARLQEVQHILRQKNALIAALEQQARSGSSNGHPPTGSPAVNGRPSSPAASTRNRRTSLGAASEKATSSRPGTPTRARKNSTTSVSADGNGESHATPRVSATTNATAIAGRTRKNSRSSLGEAQLSLSPPISSVNQFESGQPTSPTSALEPVKETRRNMDQALAAGLGDSYRSPTIASENRRIASLTQSANGAGGGSGKVIHALTTELEETRSQLETTRSRLRAAQTQASTLQRQHDDLKESLSRTRLENESNAQILSRKDRQVTEALERARKAETEAKELGRSSREWGTRVREVEAQLGEERILKGRAEAQYEAISASWKETREKLQQDVEELRRDVVRRAQENSDEAQRLVRLKTEMQEAWKQRDMEKGALGDLLESLRAQQQQVESIIQESVGGLVKRLEVFEAQTREQDDEVAYVGGELRRILRLMRSGGTDPNAP